MINEQAYKEITERILENRIAAYGHMAISKARSVSGIEISNNGKVIRFLDNPKEVIHKILVKFEETMGGIAIISARSSIMDLKNKYPDLELPEELTRSL